MMTSTDPPEIAAVTGGGGGAEQASERAPSAAPASAPRKRPKPGERRVQILRTLAEMLEQPGAERITTAALAARLEVSEAALYRHFASKAQMFEGLIEFIEQSVFTLLDDIAQGGGGAREQVQKVLEVVLQFGEKNPGMTRVMVGDALVFENERLVARMNQFFERLESQLRQCLRAGADASAPPARGADDEAKASADVGGDAEAEARGNADAGADPDTDAYAHADARADTDADADADAAAQASVLTAFLVGRLQRFARSGFKRSPTADLETAVRLFVD